MKTITYNGSSKVIKRIVELLNRKAPLPLDGNNAPDWGTNGQVLTTDGLGTTSWTTPSGGDSVSWTQIQASGTKIAEIDINGTSQDVYAPNGGGGGGHTIVDPSGTSMTQRDGLQFLDAHLADDSVNDRTKVEVVKETTEVAFDALDETDVDNDGFYAFEISGGTVIDASQVAYGNGTVEDALDSSAMEIGSNADGSFYKFNSGMLICTKKVTSNVTYTAWGSLYESSFIALGNFAYAFKTNTMPVVNLSLNNSGSSGVGVPGASNITETNAGSCRVVRPNDPGSTRIDIGLIAIGVWK